VDEIKTIDIEAEVAKRALQYEKELEEVMCSLFRVPSEFVTNYPDRSSTELRMRGILWSVTS